MALVSPQAAGDSFLCPLLQRLRVPSSSSSSSCHRGIKLLSWGLIRQRPQNQEPHKYAAQLPSQERPSLFTVLGQVILPLGWGAWRKPARVFWVPAGQATCLGRGRRPPSYTGHLFRHPTATYEWPQEAPLSQQGVMMLGEQIRHQPLHSGSLDLCGVPCLFENPRNTMDPFSREIMPHL